MLGGSELSLLDKLEQDILLDGDNILKELGISVKKPVQPEPRNEQPSLGSQQESEMAEDDPSGTAAATDEDDAIVVAGILSQVIQDVHLKLTAEGVEDAGRTNDIAGSTNEEEEDCQVLDPVMERIVESLATYSANFGHEIIAKDHLLVGSPEDLDAATLLDSQASSNDADDDESMTYDSQEDSHDLQKEPPLLMEVVDSIFTPGMNSRVQAVMHVAFALLFLTFLGLLFMTSFNYHVMVLLGISLCLWITTTWFVARIEFDAIDDFEHVGKHKSE